LENVRRLSQKVFLQAVDELAVWPVPRVELVDSLLSGVELKIGAIQLEDRLPLLWRYYPTDAKFFGLVG
jgi:hypothetical protein